jgi:hypothetical protein
MDALAILYLMSCKDSRDGRNNRDTLPSIFGEWGLGCEEGAMHTLFILYSAQILEMEGTIGTRFFLYSENGI